MHRILPDETKQTESEGDHSSEDIPARNSGTGNPPPGVLFTPIHLPANPGGGTGDRLASIWSLKKVFWVIQEVSELGGMGLPSRVARRQTLMNTSPSRYMNPIPCGVKVNDPGRHHRRCKHTTGPEIVGYRPSVWLSPAVLTGEPLGAEITRCPGSATPPDCRSDPVPPLHLPRVCGCQNVDFCQMAIFDTPPARVRVPGLEGVTVGRMGALHLEGLDGIRRAGRPGRRPPGGAGGCGTGRVGGYPFEEIRVYLFEDRIPALHPGSKMPVVENAVGPGRGSKPGFVLVSRARVFGVFPAGRAPRRGLFGAFQNL